jgi:hypothetical protein
MAVSSYCRWYKSAQEPIGTVSSAPGCVKFGAGFDKPIVKPEQDR